MKSRRSFKVSNTTARWNGVRSKKRARACRRPRWNFSTPATRSVRRGFCCVDDAEERPRRHRQVEEPLHVTTDLPFGARHRVDEFARAVFFGGREGEILLELLPI